MISTGFDWAWEVEVAAGPDVAVGPGEEVDVAGGAIERVAVGIGVECKPSAKMGHLRGVENPRV